LVKKSSCKLAKLDFEIVLHFSPMVEGQDRFQAISGKKVSPYASCLAGALIWRVCEAA